MIPVKYAGRRYHSGPTRIPRIRCTKHERGYDEICTITQMRGPLLGLIPMRTLPRHKLMKTSPEMANRVIIGFQMAEVCSEQSASFRDGRLA